jgi:signal transduction histidine kinase
VEQLQAEQQRIAVLDERSRVAREVHDVLAHSLGALGIQIQAVRAVLTDNRDVERALGLLDQAQRMASDGLGDTRRAVAALRGDSIRLDHQLTTLVEAHRDRYCTAVDLTIAGEPQTISPEATVALIRTAQEALVNTAKHATFEPVKVELSYGDNDIGLLVSNPLPNRPDATSDGSIATLNTVNGGYGLTGMRERLLLINGTLTITSDDYRWSVLARCPND